MSRPAIADEPSASPKAKLVELNLKTVPESPTISALFPPGCHVASFRAKSVSFSSLTSLDSSSASLADSK